MLQVKAQVAERVSDTLARASDLEAQLEQAHDACKQVALQPIPLHPTAPGSESVAQVAEQRRFNVRKQASSFS